MNLYPYRKTSRLLNLWLLLLLPALLPPVAVRAQATAAPTLRSLTGQFDPHAYGAKGDGITNDSAAIQAAINAAGAAGGGVVPLQNRRYLCTSPLVMKDRVTLRGMYTGPPHHSKLLSQARTVQVSPTTGGTTLIVNTTGTASGTPFIDFNYSLSATVEGIVFYDPQQVAYSGSTPVSRPWTIKVSGLNHLVQNCEINNAHQGIYVYQCDRPTIRNITLCAFAVGLRIDNCWDVPRLIDLQMIPVHLQNIVETSYPTPAADSPTLAWQYANTVAFWFEGNDELIAQGLFVFGCKFAFLFTPNGNSKVTYGTFTSCVGDTNNETFRFEAASGFGGYVGVRLIGCGAGAIKGTNPTGIHILPGSDVSVIAEGCSFWGGGDKSAYMEGSGVLMLSGCHFRDWTSAAGAVQSTTGRLLVNGCTFKDDDPQITIGSGTPQAVITNNLLTGTQRITNNGAGAATNYIISNNAHN